ncbi:MAG: alpha/beta hydrolase [Sedimenticola sp.]
MNHLFRHLSLLALLAVAALAAGCVTTSGYDSKAEYDPVNGRIGVIVMHGKGGKTQQHNISLVNKLRAEGFRVIEPLMPWSGSGGTPSYNDDIDGAMEILDKHIATLHKDGADIVFLAGHSMGAMGAYVYGGYHGYIDGVIGVAPGHTPSSRFTSTKLAKSISKARKMVANGKGDETASFQDFNMGQVHSLRTTAKNYFSYLNPNGKCNLQKSLSKLGEIPILWLAADQDKAVKSGFHRRIFSNAPANAMSDYREMNSSHLDAPSVGAGAVVAWIRKVSANKLNR